jgi:hypothetical protein
MRNLIKLPGHVTSLVFALLATAINWVALACLLVAYHAHPDKHLLQHPTKGTDE